VNVPTVNLLPTGRLQQTLKIPEALGGFLVEHDYSHRTGTGPGRSGLRSSNSEERTSSLQALAIAKEQELWKTKLAHHAKSFWYPYATLRNIPVLEQLLRGVGLDLLELCRGDYGRVADIGAADGDLAFLLEELGFSVDLIDNEYTNLNKLDGARILKRALNSSVTIHSMISTRDLNPSARNTMPSSYLVSSIT
jgi:hypothetical protein